MLVDPKSAKKTVKLSSFIALLGSGRVKAARRMLVKLTPDAKRKKTRELSYHQRSKQKRTKSDTQEEDRDKEYDEVRL